MSFDAGAIVGTLKLDMSEYAHGILQAQAVSAVFPQIVIEFLENPLLGFISIVKEAGAAVGEFVEQIGGQFHSVGLAAERAGVGVEWLSRLGAVAQTAGVGIDQLVTGFKILEQRAELASEGDKAATEGFARLGISAKEAAALMATPQQLFERIHRAIDSIHDPSQRTAAALGVLGRQGFNLVPLLTKSQQEIDSFGKLLGDLGGTVSEEEAHMGETFGQLEAIVSAAWTGIKKAIAEPILEALGGDADTLTEKIATLAGEVRGGVVTAFELLSPIIKGLWAAFGGLADVVGSVLKPVFQTLLPVLQLVADVLGVIFSVIGDVLSVIGGLVTGITDLFGITDPAQRAAAAAGQQQKAAGEFHFHAHVDGIDAETAAATFADKAIPHIHKALKDQREKVQHAAQSEKVSHALRGGH